MKKYFPYIVVLLLTGAVAALLFSGNRKRNKKVFDQRITLNKKDKIPYGTYVAFNSLKELFPEARIIASRDEPGYWDSVSTYSAGQAYVFIGDKFSADEYEMKKLIQFAENGNDVFISARYISAAADRLLNCASSSFDLSYIRESELKDSLKVSLTYPPFQKDTTYQYPGLTFSSYFSETDTTITDVLGYDEMSRINFIHLAAGKGHFYVHLEPLAFSNYFLLHKGNMDYFEKALSGINPDVDKIIWDEYYLAKLKRESQGGGGNGGSSGNNRNSTKGWFSVLMNMENEKGDKSFRAAFWLLLLLLAIYTLTEMRRKQRIIPVVKPLKNDSLDFVKTIGRLYYGKGDHGNLCRKMGAYFLEHVRGKYKLPTNMLDDKFIKTLQYKSGAAEHEIRSIVSYIKYLEENPPVGESMLKEFYEQLENFYKKA